MMMMRTTMDSCPLQPRGASSANSLHYIQTGHKNNHSAWWGWLWSVAILGCQKSSEEIFSTSSLLLRRDEAFFLLNISQAFNLPPCTLFVNHTVIVGNKTRWLLYLIAQCHWLYVIGQCNGMVGQFNCI